MSYYEITRETNNCIAYRKGRITFPAHFHKNLEFVYALSNNFEVYLDSDKYTLNENQLLIIDSYSVHNIVSQTTAISLILPVALLGDFFIERKDKVFSCAVINDQDKSLLSVIQAFKNINEKNFLIQKGLVNYFLGILTQKCPLINNSNKKEQLLLIDIIKHLNQNYDKPLTLESVAENFNYSKFTISHYFKRQTGMNFKSYLSSIRLNNFMEKYRNKNGKTISDLISECGFESPQTFYRVFKAVYGANPKSLL